VGETSSCLPRWRGQNQGLGFLTPFPSGLLSRLFSYALSFLSSCLLILLSDEALMKLATLLLRGRSASVLLGASSPSTLPSQPASHVFVRTKGDGEVNASSSPLAPVAPALPGWYSSRRQRARGGRTPVPTLLARAQRRDPGGRKDRDGSAARVADASLLPRP
jgi:hypothetical protein